MRKIITAFLFLISAFTSIAQLVESKEVEIAMSNSVYEDLTIVPLDSNGVIIVKDQQGMFNKKAKLIITKYDKNLVPVWFNNFDPGLFFELEKYYLSTDGFYCLLKEKNGEKIKILKIDLDKGDLIFIETELLTNIQIEHFVGYKSKVMIGGEYNDRPVVELHRMFDKSAKVLPGIYNNHLEIQTIETNEPENEFYLMMRETKKCAFRILSFDLEGKKINEVRLEDKNKKILNANILKINEQNQFMAGSFAEDCGDLALGFYYFPIKDPEKRQYIKFSEFENFYTYLPEKRQEKLKKRKELKAKKGKEFKIKYKLNLQQPFIFENEVMLLAEVYFPEYKSNTYISSRTPSINTYDNGITRREATNFRYTHAIMMSFDFEGKKTWDYSIDLKNLASESLLDKVQANHVGNKVLVAYPKEETIQLKWIKKGHKAETLAPLDLKKTNASKLSEISVEMISWFPQTFLVFGYKKTNTLYGGESGEFFYMKKMEIKQPDEEKDSN
ncbi:MAG: hypothetical protein LCH67_05425 [Bacteroidetes bacterium]|nr:hypothetical protein [Bacteroidota bacterium]